MNKDPKKDVYLQAPDLSDEAITGYKAGIRPFRYSGVRIEQETLGDKLLIHNYGYGGSGLTLCWGGASEVLARLALEKVPVQRVAVLGAGVIGMACAYDLLAHGFDVTLYADKFTPDLTSNVAAGIFSYPVLHGKESELQKKLLSCLFDLSALRYLKSLSKPEFKGIHLVDDYIFDKDSLNYHLLINEYKGVVVDEAEVMVHFNNGKSKEAVYKKVLALDGKLFINDLYAQIKAKGAQFVNKHFNSSAEIEALDEEIVVNCTSLGSRDLFNDRDFIPVRGQLVYFKPQPGVTYSTYESTEDKNYWVKIFPWHDRIILNGVYEYGMEDAVVNKPVIYKLLEYARARL